MIRKRLMTISIVALHVLVAVWVIAVFRPDTFRYGTIGDSASIMLMFDRGQLRLSLWLSSDPPAATGEAGFERYGFGYRAEVNITPTSKVNRMFRVMMPMWALIALCAFYPTLVFLRGPLTRLRRRRLNQCPPCGYSLEGNLSGICPECGSITPAAARAYSRNRPASAMEHLFWSWFQKVVSRRGVLVVFVVIVALVGLDVLRDRPWESPMTRAYRLCGENGVTREDIDTAILGFRGGFSLGTPLYEKVKKAFSRNASIWSEECSAAMRDAASAGAKANAKPRRIPMGGR